MKKENESLLNKGLESLTNKKTAIYVEQNLKAIITMFIIIIEIRNKGKARDLCHYTGKQRGAAHGII